MAGVSGAGRPGAIPPNVPLSPVPMPMELGPALTQAPDVVNTDLTAMAEQAGADVADPLADLRGQFNEVPTEDDPLADLRRDFNTPEAQSAETEETPEEETTLASKANSALAGAQKFTTFGYSPQIAGAAGALGAAYESGSLEGLKENYIAGRDENAAETEQAYKDNPGYYAGGGAVGALLSGGGIGVAGKAAGITSAAVKAKTLGQAAGTAAKGGALWGALANPGDTEGEINPVQLAARASGAGIGLVTGGVLGAGIYGAGKGIGAAAQTEVAQKIGSMFSKYYGKIKPNAQEIQAVTKDLPKEKAVLAQLKYAQELSDKAKSAGVSLQAHELFPQDPSLQAAYRASLASSEAKAAQLDRAAHINEFITGVKDNFKSGGKSGGQAIGEVGGLLERTGKDIGDMRSQIIAASESPRGNFAPEQTFNTESVQQDLFNLPGRAELGVGPNRVAQGSVAQKFKIAGANEANANAVAEGQIGVMNQRTSQAQAARLNAGEQMRFEPGKVIEVSTNNLNEALPGIRSTLGFANSADGSFLKPTPAQINELATRMNIPKNQLHLLVDDVSRLSDKLINNEGKLSPRELDKLRKGFQTLVDAHEPGATDAPNALFKLGIKLKDAARDDFDTAGEVVFSGNAEKMAAFKAHRERYSFLKQLPSGVQKLLDNGSQATDDMVAWFEGGGFQKNEQVKAFMQAAKLTSPEASEAIGQAYTKSFFNKFGQSVDGDKLRFGDLNAKASEYLSKPVNYSRMETIVGAEKAAQIKNLADSVKTIQQGNPGSFQESAGALRYVKALVNFKDPQLAMAILHEAKSVQKILSSKPIEQWTAKMTKLERESFLNIYNRALAVSGSRAVTQDRE